MTKVICALKHTKDTMDEEQFIDKVGMATSSSFCSRVDKADATIKKYLKRLAKFQIIQIEEFHGGCGIRNIYIKDEIHKDIFRK